MLKVPFIWAIEVLPILRCIDGQVEYLKAVWQKKIYARITLKTTPEASLFLPPTREIHRIILKAILRLIIVVSFLIQVCMTHAIPVLCGLSTSRALMALRYMIILSLFIKQD